MSHSVFKEQKCFNFHSAIFSGFPVEAADNLSNSLIESTAFFKKKFSNINCLNLASAQSARFVSNKAGHSSDHKQSRNPQVQLFFTSIKDQNPPRFAQCVSRWKTAANVRDPFQRNGG